MMGLAGRASGGPSAPPQGGWVGKENCVSFRQGNPIIWQASLLFAQPRELPRIHALSAYQRQRQSGQRIYDPTTFNPKA